MPAATPRFYFQPLCQHEVLRVISTLHAGSLCSRHVNYGTDYILYQMSHFAKFLSQIFDMHTRADAN